MSIVTEIYEKKCETILKILSKTHQKIDLGMKFSRKENPNKLKHLLDSGNGKLNI